jgi:phage virion morphogenesis protein
MFAVITPTASAAPTGGRIWAEDAIRNGMFPLEKVGQEMLAFTAQRFATGTDPDGNPWAPLRPRTIRYKRGSGVLQETGRLRSSFTMAVETATNRARVRGEAFYGRFHQSGIESPEGGMRTVARPIFPERAIPTELDRRIRVITREEMDKALDAHMAALRATRASVQR